MDTRADIAPSGADEEALRWLLELDDLPETGRARFRNWLDECPQNRAAFVSLERDWRRLDAVRQLATGSPDPDVVSKWLRRRRWRHVAVPIALAAGFVAGLGAIAFGASRCGFISWQSLYTSLFAPYLG